MKIIVKIPKVYTREVDVQLPLFWKLDNWFHKIEHANYINVLDEDVKAIQLTSVTNNCISRTLMTLEQFNAYYNHYYRLYDEITEQEFIIEFDKLNNYLK